MENLKVPRTIWTVECTAADGTLKWKEEYKNLVTDQGINDLLSQYFKGAGYTAGWYVGLIGNSPEPALLETDTMASHAGWVESSAYTALARPLLQLGPIGNKVVNNSSNKATFTINSGVTIAGSFLANSSAKGGAVGILYSEALFESGDKPVVNGDLLTVTCNISGEA